VEVQVVIESEVVCSEEFLQLEGPDEHSAVPDDEAVV
jgi:hypothetical protein